MTLYAYSYFRHNPGVFQTGNSFRILQNCGALGVPCLVIEPLFSVLGNAPKLDGDYIPLNVIVESDEDGATGKASKGQAHRKTFSRRTEEVESDSDTSDDSIMVKYGAQRVSQRKRDSKQEKADDMDENEIALALLGGRSKKRSLSLSKGSKAKKSRRPRDSDSEESDESSIVCELCKKKIPKELYRQHADEELDQRKRAKRNVLSKAEGA